MNSSLVWGDGFVEIRAEAQEIALGDMVRFLSFSGFSV